MKSAAPGIAQRIVVASHRNPRTEACKGGWCGRERRGEVGNASLLDRSPERERESGPK